MRLTDAIRTIRSVRPHHARVFAKTVIPEVVRPARVIWNQAIGALFIILAVPAVMKALQLYRELERDPRSGFGLILSIIFAIVMASFGIASFIKARRIARS
jgi:putative Ca2+/H+ antiporter (TMEM165/GDT1 family)